MGDAAQKSFFFPVGLRRFGIGDDGRFGVAPAQAFDDPDAFHAHQIGVQDARADQAMNEQRFAFVHIQAVNDPILLGIQSRADRFGKIRMRGQNQNGFHYVAGVK